MRWVNWLPNLHTYYLVVYISVVHLKCHVKFEVVPQYSSDDICGHVISVIVKSRLSEKRRNIDSPGMAYMSIGIADLVRRNFSMEAATTLTLLVRNCTRRPFWFSSQLEQKVPWIL